MNLVNKKVTHEAFGIGNVVNYDDSYININFKSGDKKFSFPDAFKNYIKFIDDKATKQINEKIEKNEERRKREELILKKKKALEKQRQYILKQKERINSGKVYSEIQSVFWCDPNEEEEIFTDWKVFTGEIQSGKNKGNPRQFARMNHSSACLITKREDGKPEKNRQILGVFMANDSFNGRKCVDGYITAHPDHRIQLTEEESKKMLFWLYYYDRRASDKTIWNSGRQRYFDNIWMAQILRDIAALRDKTKGKEEAQAFYEYFCNVNFINPNELSNPNGALTRM